MSGSNSAVEWEGIESHRDFAAFTVLLYSLREENQCCMDIKSSFGIKKKIIHYPKNILLFIEEPCPLKSKQYLCPPCLYSRRDNSVVHLCHQTDLVWNSGGNVTFFLKWIKNRTGYKFSLEGRGVTVWFLKSFYISLNRGNWNNDFLLLLRHILLEIKDYLAQIS